MPDVTREQALAALEQVVPAHLRSNRHGEGFLGEHYETLLSFITGAAAEIDRLMESLREIALAGMSGTGMESEEGMRDWHARQAWKFIGIAARALGPSGDPRQQFVQRAEEIGLPTAARELGNAIGVAAPFKCGLDGAASLCQACKPIGQCKFGARPAGVGVRDEN